MEQNKEYFVFISYSSLDNEWAIWLRHELEHYHLPASFNGCPDVRQNLRPVFCDIDELSAGNLSEQIQQALVNSQNLIVICSLHSANSVAVNMAVEKFIAMDKGDHIFPFIVEGNSPNEYFPKSLDHNIIGSDVNWDGGRDAAFIKLVSGLLKVKFDDLWNRYELEKAEEERKLREQRDMLLQRQNTIEQNKEYFVFISYSSLDNEWAIWLRHELEHYHLPASFNGRTDVRDNLRKVFRDRDELSAGPEWDEQVQKALEETNNLIVICSPHSAKSDAVNKEIETFIALGKEDHIFPFIVEGNNPKEYFPKSLKRSKVGGDVNKDGGRDSAFIKVVAGMLKVSFPSLWNRYEIEKAEEERKIREQRDKLLIMQSRFLAEKANSQAESGNIYISRLLAVEAIKISHTHEAENALRNSLNIHKTYLKGHLESVTFVSFNPNGNLVASASRDKTIRIWNVKDGRCIRIFEGHTAIVNSVSFSQDGNLIASSSDDKSIRVWNISTGRLTYVFSGHQKGVKYSTFSPDGHKLVSASSDCTIRIWDLHKQKCLKLLHGHNTGVNSIEYSPDGRTLLSSSFERICIWDADSYKILKTIDGTEGSFFSASYSPDGKRILSMANGNHIDIWDALTCNHVVMLEGTEYGWIFFALFSPDGKKIISAPSGREINVWDSDDFKLIKSIKPDNLIKNISYSPDNCKVALALDNGLVCISDIIEDQSIHTFLINENYGKITDNVHSVKYIPFVSFSPNGEMIMAELSDYSICFWSTETFEVKKQIFNKCFISNFSFSPNGEYLALACDNKQIQLWNVVKFKQVNTYNGHKDKISSVSFSPDGKTFVSSSFDHTIRIWNTCLGNCIKIINGHKGKVYYSSYSPDGKNIVTASEDKTVRILDSNTYKTISILKGHKDSVYFASFLIDGKHILTASADQTIRLWDLSSGMNIRTQKGRLLNINQDTKIMFLVNPENTIQLYDVLSGICIQTLHGHIDDINDISFNSNESKIVSTSDDGTIKIWKYPTVQELTSMVEEQFKDRPLTPEERKEYYLD